MRPILVLVALLLAGCASYAEKSSLADDVLVTVKGKVFDAGGNGLGNAKATLSTNNPFDFGGITDVTTGANLNGQGTRTNLSGELTMNLRGGQTKNSYGQAQDFILQVHSTDSQDTAWISRAVRFTMPDGKLVDFHMWDALRSPASGDAYPANQVTIGWTPPGDETPTSYEVEVTSRDGATVFYTPNAKGNQAVMPDFIFSPNETYGFRARAKMAYETRQSALHRLTAPANANPKLVPVKSAKSLDGRALSGLIDNNLVQTLQVPDGMILDLGSVQPVTGVVLIGQVAGPFTIQASGDVGDFSPPVTVTTTGGGGWLELYPGTTLTARYLKVSMAPNSSSPSPSPSYQSMTEVRVLEP